MRRFQHPFAFAFAAAFCVIPIACATAVETESDGQGGAGGEDSSSNNVSSASTGGGPCIYAEDCIAFTDLCNTGTCINGKCAKTPANDGVLCDDAKTCTQDDTCQAGKCSGSLKYCPSLDECHLGLCDVDTDGCIQVPGNEGQPCLDDDPCTQTGICSNGACSAGKPTDCSFLNGQCTVGVCSSDTGCMSIAANDGSKCEDGFFCTTNDVCTSGVCGGVPNTCAAPGDVCLIGSCNEVQNMCSAVPGNNGGACNDTNACTAGETCSNGLCGGGAPANNGGACDDKKACTTNDSCQNGQCAGAPVAVCQNGDGCCPAGCDTLNDDDCGGTIFLTSSNGSPGFYSFDIGLNTWAVRPSPPSVTYSQITTDGTSVFLLGSDNYIYTFDPMGNAWTLTGKGPGFQSAQPIGFFKWTPSGFYYLKDGNFEILRSDPMLGWVSMFLPSGGSSAGTFDPASGNLYIRVYGNFGVMVFNTTSNTVTQTWANMTPIGENSRTGAYYNGFFYEREWSGPLHKMDMSNGVLTNTGVTPSEGHTATDVDLATGDIYIGPYTPTGTTFQVYKASTNTLTTLAPSPAAVTNHSTIVLVK